MRRLSLCGVICLALAAQAAARDIYVNNVAGDDHYDGLAEKFAGGRTGPVQTINKALRVVDKGDRIVIAKTDSPYYEPLSLSAANHCGLPHLPLVIYGNGAILDGTGPVPGEAWEPVANDVFRFRPRRLTFQQLYLDGKPAIRRDIDPAVAQVPELKPLEWMLFEGHIYFRVEPGKLPEDYALRCAAERTGITLYHVRNVIIRDLVVQGFQLDGVNAHDGVNQTAVVGMTCRGNGRSGVTVANSSRLIINSCLIGDNGEAQVRVEGYSVAELVNTEIIDNTAPAFGRLGGKLLIDGKPAE